MSIPCDDDKQKSNIDDAQSDLQNYCIALQPICNAALDHVADELLYRAGPDHTFAHVSNEQAMEATARVCNIAFYETGVERLVGARQVFVNAPRDWLLKPELLPPNSKQLVVEVLETVAGEPEVLASLRQIRAAGYRVALDDFVLTEATRPLLEIANIIKVDVQQPLDEDAIALYKHEGLRLLAEKVEDFPTFERLRDRGFSLFQGYFYARPETQQAFASDRSNNHAALLRLLVALHNQDTRFKEIERLIAQDAQLTFLLLRYANSALFHYNGKIQTLFQALQVLGLRQAGSVALTMLLANHGPACRLVLSRALTRARMCERLAGGIGGSADSAFFVGILSMMGEAMGKTLSELLEELTLAQEIVDALTNREGQLGALLNDIETFEQAGTRGWPVERIDYFNNTWLKSQIWTTQILALINET